MREDTRHDMSLPSASCRTTVTLSLRDEAAFAALARQADTVVSHLELSTCDRK